MAGCKRDRLQLVDFWTNNLVCNFFIKFVSIGSFVYPFTLLPSNYPYSFYHDRFSLKAGIMSQSYRDLEVYKSSLDLFLKTHAFSLKLPKYELYELGSQVRRSSDSVNSNIVEGYGRKAYKKDFLRFLTFSRASHDETVNHLLKISKLYPNHAKEATDLMKAYETLGKRLYQFHRYVQSSWRT